LKRATKTLSWDDFKTKFKNQDYSKYHRKMKEHEFLALKQKGISVLEYKRRFHDLSLFTPHYVPSEQHMIEKLRDGFREELKQGLIALQFKTVRKLIEAAHTLEDCMEEGQQSHGVHENERIWNFQASHYFQRRVKADSSFNSRKKEGTSAISRQNINEKLGGG